MIAAVRSKPLVWLAAVVVAAACLPYLSSVGDYFLQDDFGVVQLFARRPWTMFPQWFVMPWTEDIWGYKPDELRPFVALTYQLTGKWSPARPELHHLFNIALHAGNALLIMAVARTVIGLTPLAAGFAAVVFAVLPAQVETVVWITGRVDSMPAFFYLATFLFYARWRRDGQARTYLTALALFVVALFSKQSTVTMVATLVGYDLIVARGRQRLRLPSAALAWVPFGLLTAGFLLLRRSIFGHSLRPGPESAHEIAGVLTMFGHHIRRTMTGDLLPPGTADVAMAAFLVVGVVAIVSHSTSGDRSRFVRGLCFFGVVWFAIGLAPVALAGYESPRHAYLASVGWAFSVALIVEGFYLRATGNLIVRRAVIGFAAAIIGVYVVRLQPVLHTWHMAADISKAGVSKVQEEAAAGARGTLIIAGLPRKSWEWASPFMLEPPYAPAGVRDRVHLITPWRLHCCGPHLWDAYTRGQLQEWIRTSPRPPIVVWRFELETGTLSRITDTQFPDLKEIVPVLLQTGTTDTLDGVIQGIIDRMAAGHPEPSSGAAAR
jgi:hypothetical protein